MMVALIADIAIKAVTQNAYLLPEDKLEQGDDALPILLREAPGLVLIDELDTHLHPKWQRRVVNNLKATFPSIQFVCTSHSPFIIQSLAPGELRTLDETGPPLVEYANQSIEAYPDVKLALIEAFPGTAKSCFDDTGQAVNRPGGAL